MVRLLSSLGRPRWWLIFSVDSIPVLSSGGVPKSGVGGNSLPCIMYGIWMHKPCWVVYPKIVSLRVGKVKWTLSKYVEHQVCWIQYLRKLFGWVLNELFKWHFQIVDEQGGFIRDRCCFDTLFKLQELCWKYRGKDSVLYVEFMNFGSW